MYNTLYSMGLENSTYIMSQIALGHHNRRKLDEAISMFKNILSVDPYRLDNLDTYSNLLYVLELKKDLADLAHKVVNIDKYRVETCCVIEINARDYRAWYGLGQTYEILKMPNYCLHYYKQAQQLKPNDSRMVIALGEAYEKLDATENALKCYYKACSLGDVEGTALIKLAKLYDKLNETENAAAAFTEFCLREEDREIKCFEEQAEFYNALQYLANYHLKKGELDDAYTYAYKCMECEETKEQGKALLKSIAARRIEQEPDPGVAMNETIANMSLANEEASSSNMDMVFSPSDI
ncbi:hypothetical protein NQ314_006394 [Rhamnusium bicolor]|uniref:Uncharacterized protein n=1 Tax=Rhamnusium bicolor TaxID=1586634 RepID=A0AAV8Z3S1_9CUCU|nr:hypothetical protein NQ314_006394 [Rhamnusium bicolor]